MNIPQTFDEVRAAVGAFRKQHESDGFGIAPGYEFEHIALDDYNLEDSDIQFCIDRADAWEKEAWDKAYKDYPNAYPEAREAISKYKQDVLAFFRWLLTIPEEARVWPAEDIGFYVVGEWAQE